MPVGSSASWAAPAPSGAQCWHPQWPKLLVPHPTKNAEEASTSCSPLSPLVLEGPARRPVEFEDLKISAYEVAPVVLLNRSRSLTQASTPLLGTVASFTISLTPPILFTARIAYSKSLAHLDISSRRPCPCRLSSSTPLLTSPRSSL